MFIRPYHIVVLLITCYLLLTNLTAQNSAAYRNQILSKTITLEEKKNLLTEKAENLSIQESNLLLPFFDSINSRAIILDSVLVKWVKIAHSYCLAKTANASKSIEVLNSLNTTNDKELELQKNKRFARIYLGLSDYKTALGYFQKNLVYYTVIEEDYKKQSGLLNSIQTCYYRMGMPQQAFDACEQSILAAKKSKDSAVIVGAYIAKAVLLIAQQQYKTADSLFTVFEPSILKQTKNSQMKYYSNFSDSRLNIGRIQDAEFFLNKSLNLAWEDKDTFWVTINMVRQAEIAALKNNHVTALRICEKAYEFARRKKSLIWQKNACECIYTQNLKLKNYKAALDNHLLLNKLNDSLFNESNKREMTRKEFEFEFARKSTADSILKAQEGVLKDAQIRAQKSELEKEKTMRLSLYTGGIILILFAVFMVNRYKITRKQRNEIQKQKEITDKQKELIEEKQKEIIDSINYARRIQNTLLAQHDFLNKMFQNYFIFFKPKDIVSGDFYWAAEKKSDSSEQLIYLAVCDSTGHGVPGAFVSLMNISFLNEAINDKDLEQPNEIFNYVRKRLTDSISKDGQKDGFDGILICWNKTKNIITYAAANNKPVISTKEGYSELPCDKMPVGIGYKNNSFTLFSIPYQKDETLYLYTDGFADQFGGPKGKKYKYKAMNEFLQKLFVTSLKDQENLINQEFNNWKGDLEQVDDVCVVGLTF